VLGDDFNPSEKGTSGWREKGLGGLEDASAGSLADMLEKDDDLSPPQSPPRTFTGEDEPAAAKASIKPAAPVPAAKPVTAPAATAASAAIEQPAKSGSGGTIAAVAVLAIAGIGAALWFLKIIPH
jgi:hypothetical protein